MAVSVQPLNSHSNAVQVLLELGEEQGHVWDGAAGGPSGLTPLHIAAARPGGGDLALLLAKRTAPGEIYRPQSLCRQACPPSCHL
jgi:hypothetical protein